MRLRSRQVIVDGSKLVDAVELMRLAADRLENLEGPDALSENLRGVAADLTVSSVLEPD